eukprot:EG_transcript_38197
MFAFFVLNILIWLIARLCVVGNFLAFPNEQLAKVSQGPWIAFHRSPPTTKKCGIIPLMAPTKNVTDGRGPIVGNADQLASLASLLVTPVCTVPTSVPTVATSPENCL